MIILSKLADYGVIVASYLAADPERQMTAAALATEGRLPRATVAKGLKALAHGRGAAGYGDCGGRGGGGTRRRDRLDPRPEPHAELRTERLLSDPNAVAAHQS